MAAGTATAFAPPAPSELTALVDAVARPSGAPFGAYAFGAHEPAARLGRAVEAGVFEEAFGNDAALLEAEYGPYEDASVFFVVIDHARRLPAGACRVILPGGPNGLKSVNDLAPGWCADPAAMLERELPGLPAATTWDWATLAVAPEYRSVQGYGLVSMGLYQSVVRTARFAGAEHYLAILDRAVLRMQRMRFAEPFVPYGDGRPYLGSRSSCPVHMPIRTWAERLSLLDPAIASIVLDGRGIEPAMDPLEPEQALQVLPRPGVSGGMRAG